MRFVGRVIGSIAMILGYIEGDGDTFTQGMVLVFGCCILSALDDLKGDK